MSNVKNVEAQKLKLEQKKNRLILEETRLRLKDRKMRTRHLIELGGLVTKAGLESLQTNTLYGALISLSSSLEKSPEIKDEWTKVGKAKFDQEKKNKVAVILKFETQPDNNIRTLVRDHGLKWNKFRSEWYGEVSDLEGLKDGIGEQGVKYGIEVI